MIYSRRHFGQFAIVGIGSGLVSSTRAFAQVLPNSVIAGVQIGTMVPNSLRGVPNDMLAYRDAVAKIGLSGCECHNEPFEKFLGAPQSAGRGFGAGGPPPGGGARGSGGSAGAPGGGAAQAGAPGGARGGGRRGPATPEQLAAQKARQEALTKWRLAEPMSKFAEARKLWNDAGVQPYAFKIPLNLSMPDAEYDYAFTAAKTIGASSLTMELPSDPALSARVGQFAEKHKLMVGYHAERPASPTWWDVALAQSPYNSMNLDVGHYVGAGNKDAVDFVRKNHARISSMHLKDVKFGGGSMPWGQGDTPIVPIVQMVRDRKWGFPLTIELDYRVPADSTMPDEIVKCYAYIKAALLS
jgi:sugar phosphate isomerase/epimerase